MSADAPSRGEEQPAPKRGRFPARGAAAEALRFRSCLQAGTAAIFSAHDRLLSCRRPAEAAEKNARVGFTVGRVLGGAVAAQPDQAQTARSGAAPRSTLQSAVDMVINPKKSVLTLEFALVLEEVGRAFDVIARRSWQRKNEVLWRSAMLRFYKRWISPSLVAIVPLRADLLGIRDGGDRPLWRAARRMDGGLAVVALPSFCEGRIRSGGEGRPSNKQLFSVTAG